MCQRENETVKFQIEQLLNYAVKTIKNRKRTKQVLASVKVPALLCREFRTSRYSKMEADQHPEFVSLLREQIQILKC